MCTVTFLLSLKPGSAPNLEENPSHLAIESDAASQLGLVIFPGGAEVRVSHLETVEPSAIHQSQFRDINLHQYLGRPQKNGSCLKESRCPSIALEISMFDTSGNNLFNDLVLTVSNSTEKIVRLLVC